MMNSVQKAIIARLRSDGLPRFADAAPILDEKRKALAALQYTFEQMQEMTLDQANEVLRKAEANGGSAPQAEGQVNGTAAAPPYQANGFHQPFDEAARHAEIKWRYRRRADGEPKLGRVMSLRRRQVLDLFAHRLFGKRAWSDGTTLPNNKVGADVLILLVELGLDGPAALKVAPWCESQLNGLFQMIDSQPPRRWTAQALGARLEGTLEEKITLGLHHIECSDAPPHNVQEARAKRKAALERARRERERRKKMSVQIRPREMSERSRVVLGAIGSEWMKSSAVASAVSSHEAFGGLKAGALRKAVQRSTAELAEEGVIDHRMDGGERQTVLWVRRKTPAGATI